MAIPIGERLTIEAVVDVAQNKATVTVPDSVVERISATRARIETHLGPGKPLHYGINTGFGALAEVRIDDSQIRQLQHNLVRSHACGVGDPLSEDVVRAIMLLRAQVLALGYSGCRPEVVQQIAAFLNHGIHPVIPKKGSVGASGDLAPLAHLALGLTGEGMVNYNGAEMIAKQALDATGLSPLELRAKEGLCLINGTQAMTGIGTLLLYRAEKLAKSCDLIGAITVEALTDSRTAFDPVIHQLRPHPGQVVSAANLFALLDNSEIMASHENCDRVQDPYSLRCMPQVHGATRDSLKYVRQVLEVEINAVTDNPLVFDDDRILSGGNFHGQPVAIALDLAAIGIAELANISERRIEQLVNPALNSGLPAFLAPNVGLNSGFMIAQVTAAALVSENKRLAVPASVDSIPSSANREDHVSMGMHSAVKALEVLTNVETVLAIELLCAGQGIDFRRPLRSAPGVEAAHAVLRKYVEKLQDDRILYPDIHLALELLQSTELLDAAESAIGPLG
ncbi:MAG TPA: histidine ammonia-lyase [Myxococcales bacterium]|nr:histidine ammonia-lyase [Myxococcales bacterium]HIN85328.1 histidine ammonia-lyase [Myxococcales bacterium]